MGEFLRSALMPEDAILRQLIADAAAKGTPVETITLFTAFASVLTGLGMKINLILIAALILVGERLFLWLSF